MIVGIGRLYINKYAIYYAYENVRLYEPYIPVLCTVKSVDVHLCILDTVLCRCGFIILRMSSPELMISVFWHSGTKLEPIAQWTDVGTSQSINNKN
jgi:hypothetical protein